MRNICYIGYYSDPDLSAKRQTAPAAVTKMDYIIYASLQTGRRVKLFSASGVEDRSSFFSIYSSYNKSINGIDVSFPFYACSKFRALRVIFRWLSQIIYYIRILHYLKKSHDIPIVYHSLGLVNLLGLFKLFNIEYVLEIEEIYSDVIINVKDRLRRREINCFRYAKKYILSTDLLRDKLQLNKADCIVCNGTYKVEPDRGSFFSDEKIHCIYAGTFDPRKGGATAAIKAALFLTKAYHMHICGFGMTNEVDEVQRLVGEVQSQTCATISYEGCIHGDEYISFLQSCHIGLNTHNPNAAFNATSFPSKILTYLANGLAVVSIRIPAIEQSEVGKYLFYYERQTPQEIAAAIMSVPQTHKDNRFVIENLNKSFVNGLNAMLDETN